MITSPELWRTLASGEWRGVAIAIVLWLTKTWVGERIKRDVEDTYNAPKQQQRKAELDKALRRTKIRNAAEIGGMEGGLPEGARCESHPLLETARGLRDSNQGIVRTPHLGGRSDEGFRFPRSMGPRNEEGLRNKAQKAYDEFSTFFTHNRILFSEANCELIE